MVETKGDKTGGGISSGKCVISKSDTSCQRKF